MQILLSVPFPFLYTTVKLKHNHKKGDKINPHHPGTVQPEAHDYYTLW